ncbi:MAG: hypothetical protein AAF764_03865 [Pseudomonadota bacterium]
MTLVDLDLEALVLLCVVIPKNSAVIPVFKPKSTFPPDNEAAAKSDAATSLLYFRLGNSLINGSRVEGQDDYDVRCESAVQMRGHGHT